jgi:hypothetical protein
MVRAMLSPVVLRSAKLALWSSPVSDAVRGSLVKSSLFVKRPSCCRT